MEIVENSIGNGDDNYKHRTTHCYSTSRSFYSNSCPLWRYCWGRRRNKLAQAGLVIHQNRSQTG